MKNNKLFSVLIALLVCLTVVVSASATNDDGKAELAFSFDSVSLDEHIGSAVIKPEDGKIVVAVGIDSNPGFWMSIIDVVYDNTVLTLDYENVIRGNENVKVNPYGAKGNTARVTIGDYSNALNKKDYLTGTGAVVTLTFKVAEGVDAEKDLSTAISLSYTKGNLLRDKEDEAVEVVCDELNVNVVGSKHDCSNCETVQTGAIPSCQEGAKEDDTYCAFCGKLLKEGASVEKTEHVWVLDEENSYDATCEKAGLKIWNCSVCGEQKKETPAALGHEWGEWYIADGEGPTCGNYGTETRDCLHEGCEEYGTRSVDPTGDHKWVSTSTVKAPTCTENGVDEVACSVCGATDTNYSVPAKGHTEGEWKTTKEATSEEEGEQTLYCKECNAVMQTKAIEKLPAKSNNTVVIVVVIIVTVLAAAGVAAYFVLKNKKAK